jgi:hypothetical protein
LDNRLSTLESFHNSSAKNTSDDIVNVGYPCSGLIGAVEFEYSGKIVSFEGDVYIGSNANTHFRKLTITKALTSLTSGAYYFVFLKYFQGE